MQSTSLPFRLALLLAAAATIAMLLTRVVGDDEFLALPGAVGFIAAALTPLVLYAVAIAWPRRPGRLALRPEFATLLGAAGGILQLLHLALERFWAPPAHANAALSLLFEFITFSLWGYAGFRGRRSGLSLLESWAAAVWSALVTMTLTVAGGTLLELFIAPYPLEAMRAWAEFQRSGWTDLRAFSLANTMDSIASHLLGGPIVATVFGLFGCALAWASTRRPRLLA